MFLKRIILQGFKSFATKTIIDFDNDFTGIVGPNGCGKSNIIDAIKWVLGEKSAKNMRGSSMSDVIFAGSEGKKGVNMCEVTLVFDNSSHVLNSDYTELQITRKLYKKNEATESEYLINNTNCRLKDIEDLILDTGLGKDSLSIISQGNIQAFAEAKPIERRGLFEEASGVAKYKKRKNETINKLNNTQMNLDRLNDILSELEKQVSPLKRQALKAQQYLEKKQRLTQIEVAVIVNDIANYIHDLETIEAQLYDFQYQEATIQASLSVLENNTDDLKNEMNQLDQQVNSLQSVLLRLTDEITILEKRKTAIEEKRHYILQTGTTEAKIKAVKEALDQALQELNDRLERQQNFEAELELTQQSIDQTNDQILYYRQQMGNLNHTCNSLTSRKQMLENLIKTPFEKEIGVKSIIHNKQVLPGIYDAVTNLLKPIDGYQQMIATALAGAMYHIVTVDDQSAKTAIQFLKKNKSGTATFLPMTVLKARNVPQQQLFVAEQTEGFLGLASEFVDCDEKFDIVVDSLLGNVLVCDDLNHATILAKRLNYGFKIVTIDGDVIYKGGTMAGGYNKSNDSPLTYKKQLEDVNQRLTNIQQQITKLQQQDESGERQLEQYQEKRGSLREQLASIRELINIKRSKYEGLKAEYDRIKPDKNDSDSSYEDELTTALNDAYSHKDQVTSEIALKRQRRLQANNEVIRKQAQIKQWRQELMDVSNQANGLQIEKAKILANRDNLFDRLARDYQLTYEFAASQSYDVDIEAAREEVPQLRKQIADLGNVNLDAPEDYEKANERYEFLKQQIEQLELSRQQLLSAINEMDTVMIDQFTTTFDAINQALPEVFTVLFGGGKAKLILEDPQDILNTGIDINVQPPGKSIQNIRLFSGGEKALIAICVLFAILKARPVPLCIFDEVEAALDQGNVDRFARYIHKFQSQTQFIVITHRPGTMTECDVLYGITMQQKGISNVLKVKLKDALSIVEEEKEN